MKDSSSAFVAIASAHASPLTLIAAAAAPRRAASCQERPSNRPHASAAAKASPDPKGLRARTGKTPCSMAMPARSKIRQPRGPSFKTRTYVTPLSCLRAFSNAPSPGTGARPSSTSNSSWLPMMISALAQATRKYTEASSAWAQP